MVLMHPLYIFLSFPVSVLMARYNFFMPPGLNRAVGTAGSRLKFKYRSVSARGILGEAIVMGDSCGPAP